tara:strand:- start:1659 stop:1838 length:180 start_codon:yes stop_codon:yes gene_type:complete
MRSAEEIQESIDEVTRIISSLKDSLKGDGDHTAAEFNLDSFTEHLGELHEELEKSLQVA